MGGLKSTGVEGWRCWRQPTAPSGCPAGAELRRRALVLLGVGMTWAGVCSLGSPGWSPVPSSMLATCHPSPFPHAPFHPPPTLPAPITHFPATARPARPAQVWHQWRPAGGAVWGGAAEAAHGLACGREQQRQISARGRRGVRRPGGWLRCGRALWAPCGSCVGRRRAALRLGTSLPAVHVNQRMKLSSCCLCRALCEDVVASGAHHNPCIPLCLLLPLAEPAAVKYPFHFALVGCAVPIPVPCMIPKWRC